MKDEKLRRSIINFLDSNGFYRLHPEWKKTDVNRLFNMESSPANLSSIVNSERRILKNDFLCVRTDGAARGNPGPAGIGIVIEKADGTPVETINRYIGTSTNNVAEYRALIMALQKILEFQPRQVKILMDSELVVKQVKGTYAVKNSSLKELHNEVMALLGKIPVWQIEHVRREQNKLADRLANQAIDEANK